MVGYQGWARWKGIMKAYPFEEKRLLKWKPPYIVQPKYDGVRCRAVHTDSGYILLSSEENVIFSVPHVNEELNRLPLNVELDGELYCHGMSFEDIVSITSRTQNLHPDHKCMQLHVFDIVNKESQMRRVVDVGLLEEFKSKIIQVSPFWVCYTLDEVLQTFDRLVELKYEGIIVRNIDALYERKRSIWVMKFKPKKEDAYKIVATQEEMDKGGLPKGSLGALTCLSGDGVLFNVGTGFSEEQRQLLWEVRDTLPGRIARIKYQHITSGMKVPRFPVFVEIL